MKEKHLAHYRQYDDKPQFVEDHLIGVSNVAGCFSSSKLFPNAVDCSCLLHDFGKLTEDFTQYVLGNLDIQRGTIDHSFGGAKFLEQEYKDHDQRVVKFISRAILTHHGIVDWIRNEDEDTYESRVSKDKYWSEIMSNRYELTFINNIENTLKLAEKEVLSVRKNIRELSNRYLYIGAKYSEESFAFYLCLLDRLLLSILMDADKIDTANFMYNTDVQCHYDMKQIMIESEKRLNNKLKKFKQKKDIVSKIRMSISDRCDTYSKRKNIHICKMIVPTGGGKTLSATRFAINQCLLFGKDKIFYVAPFMSILEQNSDVLKSVFGEQNVLEHHSNVLSEILSNSDSEEKVTDYELRSEKWDSPIIATTLVQFLNTIFSNKSSSIRRFHRLYNSVIIIDEIQSIPSKCLYLFNLAMNFLSYICNCTIVLCTATQPPIERAERFVYPILLDDDYSITGNVENDFNMLKRSELVYDKRRFTYDQAYDFCSDLLNTVSSMLVVTNTKKACSEMYNLLKNNKQYLVYHLSTGMCPQHRRDVLNKIIDKINHKEKVVCVSTQLIEAGVDISFECVVRSFSGLDNATQASGRCNRNGEFNHICKTYIIHMIEENVRPLIQITQEQTATETTAYKYNYDLTNRLIMDDYFMELYRIQHDSFRYPVNSNIDEDILNLLALNKNRSDVNATDRSFRFRRYAPKTAGQLFNVIDTHQTDIIVPYDSGAKKLIRAISSRRLKFVNKRLFAKLQKYTVSVFEGQLNRLIDLGIVFRYEVGDSFMYVVSETNYTNIGITENVDPDTLIL